MANHPDENERDNTTVQIIEMKSSTREGSSGTGQTAVPDSFLVDDFVDETESFLSRNVQGSRLLKSDPKYIGSKASSVAAAKNGCSSLFIAVISCILVWGLVHLCLLVFVGKVDQPSWAYHHASNLFRGEGDVFGSQDHHPASTVTVEEKFGRNFRVNGEMREKFCVYNHILDEF